MVNFDLIHRMSENHDKSVKTGFSRLFQYFTPHCLDFRPNMMIFVSKCSEERAS